MRLEGLVVALMVAGCTLDFDAVGPGAQGGGEPTAGKGQGGDAPLNGGGQVGGESAGGGHVGGAASCDAESGGCVEQPVGFSGLIELRQGAPCASAPVMSGGLAGNAVDAPDATCGCECIFNDEVCGDLDVYLGQSCDGLDVNVLADPSGCTVLPMISGQAPHSVLIELGSQPNPGCKSNQAASTKPPIGFDPPTHACAIETSLACGDTEVCLPSEGGPYCLVAEGATSCPPGPFAKEVRLATAADYVDSRVCTCGCGEANGLVTCTAPVGLAIHGNATCTGAGSTQIQSAGCFTADDVVSMSFVPDVNGTCEIAVDDPTGSVDLIPGAGQLLCCTSS